MATYDLNSHGSESYTWKKSHEHLNTSIGVWF